MEMAEKITLTKKDRQAVALRSTLLMGSWNYERMENGGFCYAMIPAIKKLYKDKDDRKAALKRHMEFLTPIRMLQRRFLVLHWRWSRKRQTACR